MKKFIQSILNGIQKVFQFIADLFAKHFGG